MSRVNFKYVFIEDIEEYFEKKHKITSINNEIKVARTDCEIELKSISVDDTEKRNNCIFKWDTIITEKVNEKKSVEDSLKKFVEEHFTTALYTSYKYSMQFAVNNENFTVCTTKSIIKDGKIVKTSEKTVSVENLRNCIIEVFKNFNVVGSQNFSVDEMLVLLGVAGVNFKKEEYRLLKEQALFEIIMLYIKKHYEEELKKASPVGVVSNK